jgi:hypothetical protein
MGVPSLVGVTDPFVVLGLSPDASREQVRAARLALVKHLHPDVRSQDAPEVRARAERRLAEVNAAYDAVVAQWSPAEVEDVQAAEAAEAGKAAEGAEVVADPVAGLASFAVGAFRPVAFEAIIVAAADVGDVTDADEPFSLELFVEGPPRGFCRLELFPEAGGSVVTADSDHVDPALVCVVLVDALQRLGVAAELLPT